jgi:hypothetical protein
MSTCCQRHNSSRAKHVGANLHLEKSQLVDGERDSNLEVADVEQHAERLLHEHKHVRVVCWEGRWGVRWVGSTRVFL